MLQDSKNGFTVKSRKRNRMRAQREEAAFTEETLEIAASPLFLPQTIVKLMPMHFLSFFPYF